MEACLAVVLHESVEGQGSRVIPSLPPPKYVPQWFDRMVSHIQTYVHVFTPQRPVAYRPTYMHSHLKGRPPRFDAAAHCGAPARGDRRVDVVGDLLLRDHQPVRGGGNGCADGLCMTGC